MTHVCQAGNKYRWHSMQILIRASYLPALFIASFESEGPENHMEKDSWKTLR